MLLGLVSCGDEGEGSDTQPPANIAPVANAGADQNITIGSFVTLDGSNSSDANGDSLSFSWSFVSVPSGSAAEIINVNVANPTFTANLDGIYTVQLIVNDGIADSSVDTVSIVITTAVSDNFDGDGALLGYTTSRATALPDVSRVAGRYRANLVNNAANVTLFFNDSQGRLDAKLVTFPFEYIARNIGIGTPGDSQTAPPFVNAPFTLSGIQIHVTNPNDRNYAQVVVGHSGSIGFTVEGKNTVNAISVFDTAGANVLPAGRADLRVVGNANQTLTVYWQVPNPLPGVQADNWTLYSGTMNFGSGNLPGVAPTFGNTAYIGLITYAFGTNGIPFVGTCDSVELVGE